jgi:hypothetical protein
VALIRATGVNRNLLYLSLVFAVYLIVATTARSPAVLAVALLFMAFLTVRPVKPPAVIFLSPEAGAPEHTLREGETLTYHFFLRGVEPFADTGGRVAGELNVHGRNLADLLVTIDGVERSSEGRRIRKYDYELARLPFESIGDHVLAVTLCARPGTKPSVLVGPEVDDLRDYPHAVYVRIESQTVSVTFHARPEEALAAR